MDLTKDNNFKGNANHQYSEATQNVVTQANANDIIRKACKPLPAATYKDLPSLIGELMCVYDENTDLFSERARDILLLSLLVGLGMCFPTARFDYGPRRHSINPSLIISGFSASDKSIMKFAIYPLEYVNEYIIEEYRERRKEWMIAEANWEREKQAAKKENRDINCDLMPGDEPKFAVLVLSANSSKSQLLRSIKANEQYGSLVNTTELNSFNSANRQDYGQMDDLFNKALVNEKVDKNHTIDGEPIVIYYPIVSFLGSGTPDQTHCFIFTFETGYGSRFPIYQTSGAEKYIVQKPKEDAVDYSEYYKSIGKEVLQMWSLFKDYKWLITFTDGQWATVEDVWAKLFDDVITSAPELSSVELRFGFHQLRFACVLTMLRLWDEYKADKSAFLQKYADVENVQKVVCNDTDFTASKHIATTLFEHTMMFASSKMKSITPGVKNMEQWRWQDKVLREMNDEFCHIEFFAKAQEMGYNKSEKTCYRVLDNMSKGSGKVLRKLKNRRVDGKMCYAKMKNKEK